jgi:type IV pilus assembly protein PilC
MPVFAYKAMREDGTSVIDQLSASSSADARQALEAKGYLVMELRKKGERALWQGQSQKDFLIFNQEFMTLVKAGLPILQALEVLHHRMERPGLRAALEGVIEAIRGGTALSDAMSVHPRHFPPLYTSTVRAGEQSGALVDVLKRYIIYQKRILAVRAKVRNALFYPVFLVIATTAVITLFFLYVIPNFSQMYGDHAGKLPFLTSLLLGLTTAARERAPIMIAVLAGGAAGLLVWRKTAAGRRTIDGLKLRIPLVRSLLIQYLLAQLTRTLSTLLRGGIPLVQALDTTAGVIGNQVIGRRLRDTRELVTEGVSLSDAFERTRLAPAMTVRMIEVGESSGDLPQMLEDVSDFYEQEVENRLTNLTSMIEPLLMLIMGLVIAVIVVALYLPIFEMGAQLK